MTTEKPPDNCLPLNWTEVAAQNGWRKLRFDGGVVYAVIEYIPDRGWRWEVQVRGEGTSERASSILFRVSSSQYSSHGNDDELDCIKHEVARAIAWLPESMKERLIDYCNEIAAISQAKELLKPYVVGDALNGFRIRRPRSQGGQ